MSTLPVKEAVWALVFIALFVVLFLRVFRAMRPLHLLKITPRDRRWLRRNKMWPYYFLFALFLLIPVAGAIYKIIEVVENLAP